MLQLTTDNTNIEIEDKLKNLDRYTERLRQVRDSGDYIEPESSLNLANDSQLLEQVRAMASEKVTDKLKYTIVVGIGGSNLGTKAIYDALLGSSDILCPQRFPKLLFAETTDPQWLSRASQLIKSLSGPEEVLVVVISKSGGTTETLANFEIIFHELGQKFTKEASSRVVAITDEGSAFMKAASSRNISCLAIPAPVGGRYSVLSAVGLLPLLSVGIDIEKLRQGASDLLDRCLSGDNIAATSAAVLALSQERGYHINDNFFFHPELESLGKWYRQLMGESIGKEKSLQGEVVHAGITPTVSLGSTDLHSVGQLYLGGPRDKITTFVVAHSSSDIRVPDDRVFDELAPMIAHKTASDIMSAILDGVKIAYKNAGLPYMELALETIDERCLGAYLQFKMLEMMYLGQLLNVNSFDQPSVESYKIETKHLLEGVK